MSDLWVSVSAANSQQKKVETIANNIANTNTAGFKRDDIVFKEYLTALDDSRANDINLPRNEWAPEDFYKHDGAQNSYVKTDGTYTIFEQGALTPTNNPFDLAIKGNGFFEVLTKTGTRYIRGGSFSLSPAGELITDRGEKVLKAVDRNSDEALKTKPEDRVITLPPGRPTITEQGKIYVGENQIGDISVVEFQDVHALKKEGAHLYSMSDDANILKQNKSSMVLQGYVEQSNVNPIYEMSELIKAHRHFESIQKAIKTYDAVSTKGANDLARF